MESMSVKNIIWINPVVEAMYDPDDLNEFLAHQGYQRVCHKINWGDVVLEKYRNAVAENSLPVMDMRCPKAVEEIKLRYHVSSLYYPDIEPILLHCAREISAEPAYSNAAKWIITPCRILADEGNRLGLVRTRFLSWKDFLKEKCDMSKGPVPRGHRLEESPLPLGYFRDLPFKTQALSARDFERNLSGFTTQAQLVEALYCQNGCSHGDGVLL